MREAKPLKAGLALSLLVALIHPIASAPVAAATVACNPIYDTPSADGSIRNFIFKDIGVCTWTVPANMFVQAIAIFGGGGGGGGGSWTGTSHGGGGGGGGSGGVKRVTDLSFIYRDSTHVVSIGPGGIGGAGAAASQSLGTTGSSGNASSFGTWSASGGSGGGGGGNDQGGGGGTSGQANSGATYAGGNQANGNGGAGGSSLLAFAGENAGAQPGEGFEGTQFNQTTFKHPSNFLFAPAGSGGASGSNTSLRGGTTTQAPAIPAANSGGGGNGGHGCSTTSVTCANRSGSSGASGQVVVAVKWLIAGLRNTESLYVGEILNSRIGDVPPSLGTGTWSGTLPNGFTINPSTGVVTGTSNTPRFLTGWVSYVDSAFPASSIDRQQGIVFTRAPQNINISTPTLELGESYRIPIEQFKGNGRLTIQNSAGECSPSGVNNETITALASTTALARLRTSCTIQIIKEITPEYFGVNMSLTINTIFVSTMTTLTSTSATTIEAGSPINLNATVDRGATGDVSFYAGSSLIQSCGAGTGLVALSSGSASCTWTPSAGSGQIVPITAKYLGFAKFGTSTSSALNRTVYPSISLAYTGSTSTFGNSATISPTVSGGTGAPSSWSWGITKSSDNSNVTGVSINSSGVISISSSLAAGTYNMNVRATDGASIVKVSPVNIFVSQSTPTVRINQPSKSALTLGQSISLTAALPVDATGTVIFKFGATTISGCGSAGSVSVSSGAATCVWNTAGVATGTYDITAAYSGGGSYTATTSNPLSISVNPRAIIGYGDQTFDFGSTASIAPNISSNTGTGSSSEWAWSIVRTSDSEAVAEISIDSAGLISTTSQLGAGLYPLTVSAVDLAGDTATATINLSVNKVQPTITISPRTVSNTILPEATAGRQISWKIESTHRSSGAIAVFVDNSNINCTTSILFSDGQCWWSSSNANSTVSAFATFAGDANLETATSNIVTNFKINPALLISYPDLTIFSGFETSTASSTIGGTGTKLYSMFQHITGLQVLGISIDSSTGVISASRSATPGIYRMNAMVTDLTNSSSIDDSVVITVLEQVQPNFSISQSLFAMNKDAEIAGNSLSHTSTPGFFYTISPALPAGLSLLSETGEIVGAPTATLTSTLFTITATNNAGSSTSTFTLSVSENLMATITLAIGTNPAAKGTSNTLIATISAAGKVQFFINNKKVPGCVSLSGTTSVTCNWRPAVTGTVTVKAKLVPINGSIPTINSSAVQVSVGRRTGPRTIR